MSTSLNDAQSYNRARIELIDKDRALRRDNPGRRSLTSDEAKADEVIRQIRLQEANTVWSAEHEGVAHPFPGMEFLTGKSIVVKAQLFKILKKMPKGGLLHCHMDATVECPILLKMALAQPAIHIRTPEKLNASTIGSVLPQFLAIPEAEYTDASNLFADSYVPGQWVQIQKARENFDPTLGGPAGFDKWVLSTMTIDPAEAYGTHNTITKIWEKFMSTFSIMRGIIYYIPIWEQYVRQSLLASIEDGISYVEPRINFYDKFMVSPDGQQNVPHREWLIIFDRVVNELKEELKAQGREDEFIGARIIYSTVKIMSAEDLYWYTEDCITLKKEFPHLIAGFDLVGPENICKPLIYYLQPLLDFKSKVAELGLELPLILHAGETLGDGDAPDTNMYDAILLGTKRIGHGFSIVKHPELMRICREKDILIEVCPISNEILRLTSSMPMHPLPIMLNQGIPVALCSDDPCQFGSMGLTFDFYQVIAASEVTGLIMLGQMARDSLQYSTLNEEDKSRAMAAWERRWAKFVKEVASLSPQVSN